MGLIRGGKLKLKGEKPKALAGVSKSPSKSAAKVIPKAIQEEKVQGWADVQVLGDLSGPIVILAPDEPPLILTCSEDGKLAAKNVTDYDLPTALGGLEPNDVSQVFVVQSLLPGKYSIKTSTGKYLSSNAQGRVTANKEAIGPSEEWTPILVNGGVAWHNFVEKFLSIERATSRVICNSDSIGFAETFRVRCHAAKKESTKNIDDQVEVPCDLETIEERMARKYQSWTTGGTRISSQSKAALKKAEEEGRLHEALLERRMKTKHDPFC